MRARVRLRLDEQHAWDLYPGDVVGRLATAALRLADGRISEAHAMVSLRGRDLKLLALRGRLAVAGAPVPDVVLHPGLEVSLARGLSLMVEYVELPDKVLGIGVIGESVQVLNGVTSLFGGTRPRLVAGWRKDADACVWPDGEGWQVQVGEAVSPLAGGQRVELDGVAFETRWLAAPSVAVTEHRGGIQAPLRIVARFDSVHLIRTDAPVVRLTGKTARLVSELVACGAPVGWLPLARDLWGSDRDPAVLRKRWDVLLFRLRARLREVGVRTDLIRADGKGQVELVLADGDVVVDET